MHLTICRHWSLNELRFGGFISWELEERKLEIMSSRDSKKCKRRIIEFVWDGKGDASTDKKCRDYLQRFCEDKELCCLYGSWQWDTCKRPHEDIWRAVNARWGYPRLQVLEEEENEKWEEWKAMMKQEQERGR